MNAGNNFLHLNRDGCWPDFQWSGLELAPDGALELATLPRYAGEVPAVVAELPSPDCPAGIAVDPCGRVFWSDPQGHRLARLDPDDGSPTLLLAGEGDVATELSSPRGLVFHPARPALVVADGDDHRLRLFDPGSWQLRDVWGGPGDDSGCFETPLSLAADPEGYLYVADRRRVQKLDLRGEAIGAFWEAAATAEFDAPAEVAVVEADDGGVEIFVLDPSRGEIVVLAAGGEPLRSLPLPGLGSPAGLLVHEGAIYLGDNDRRRLCKLWLDGTPVGEAAGWEGPVAGLAADPEGGLWLHPGGPGPPHRLELRGAHVRSGVLWGSPFAAGDRPRAWQRLQALGAPTPPGAHLRFHLHATDAETEPPEPDAAAQEPFAAPWRALAPDVPDVLVGTAEEAARYLGMGGGVPPCPKGGSRGDPRYLGLGGGVPPCPKGGSRGDQTYLWIGLHLEGDGVASPRLEQLRLAFDQESLARHLPAIYSDPRYGADPALVERFLALFASFFTDLEEEIGGLGRYFDPEAVPAAALPWLAGWLALELEEDWPEDKHRQALAGAFAAAASRGTARGLRAALRFHPGVVAHVQEPLARGAWWALAPPGETDTPAAATSLLGVSTRLVPAEPQGAVVGTTATLDRSHLIRDEEYGAPVFEETAYRFCVELYRAQVTDPEVLAAVREVIEREKPAHTDYHLGFIRPGLRVGYQARLGIDTVVGGRPAPTRLGETTRPGAAVVVSDELIDPGRQDPARP